MLWFHNKGLIMKDLGFSIQALLNRVAGYSMQELQEGAWGIMPLNF